MKRVGSPSCRDCPKVPNGAPNPSAADSIELDERGRQAYEFYLECKAVGQWPDDYAVRRIAKAIRQTEDLCQRVRGQRSQAALSSAIITAAATQGMNQPKKRVPLSMLRR